MISQFGTFQYSEPRAIVIVNGNRVPFFSYSVVENGYGAADTFSLELPFRILSNLTGVTDLANTPTDASSFFTEADILVEIYEGYPPDPNNYSINDLTQVIYGYMDNLDIYIQDAEKGYYVQLQGRNQVAPFIDNESTNKYPNMTSSAIASYLAQLNGLSTNITPTYTTVGTYYANDNVKLTHNTSQWDLLLYLAQKEGFMVAVSGNTLFFGPQSKLLNSNSILYTINKNVYSLQLSRSPHASRDITVTVISWQPGKKTHIVSTAKRTTGYISKIKGTMQRQAYQETYYYPGMDKNQTQQKANEILQQLSSTEITGKLVTYGIVNQNIYQPLQISGIGAGIDGVTFWPTQVTHTFDLSNSTSGSYNISISFSNLLLPTNPGGLE